MHLFDFLEFDSKVLMLGTNILESFLLILSIIVLHLTRTYGEGQVNLSIYISTSTSWKYTVGLID